MLRLRRHLRRQVFRTFRRHGAHQGGSHPPHRRPHRGFARHQLPDADPRRALPRRFQRPHHAPRGGPRFALTPCPPSSIKKPTRRWPTPTSSSPFSPPPAASRTNASKPSALASSPIIRNSAHRPTPSSSTLSTIWIITSNSRSEERRGRG